MAKIVRFNGNLQAFASQQLANERTVFGELTIANDLSSQFTADFLRGWGIVGPSDQPSLQDFNAVNYTHGQLLAYLHQMGVAEYNSAQEYYVGSVTTSAGVIYISLTAGNIGNTPASSPAQWKPVLTEVPDATETVKGIVELATVAEATAGIDTVRAVTPAGVKAAIDATAAPLPQGYFFGFTIFNDAGSPNTSISIGTGSARNFANTLNINLSGTITGIAQTSGAWAAGNNQNKLDTGARTANTWYHAFAIRKTSDGTGDILFSTNLAAPVMPSGYSGFVLVESFLTDASNNIVQFYQNGRTMTWKNARQDVSLGTSAAGNSTVTISTPPARRVMVKQYAAASANSPVIYTHSPDVNDETLGIIAGAWTVGISTNDPAASADPIAGYLECLTGLSSNVRLQTANSGGSMFVVQLTTLGWEKVS